jgi:hypothetical protein
MLVDWAKAQVDSSPSSHNVNENCQIGVMVVGGVDNLDEVLFESNINAKESSYLVEVLAI